MAEEVPLEHFSKVSKTSQRRMVDTVYGVHPQNVYPRPAYSFTPRGTGGECGL